MRLEFRMPGEGVSVFYHWRNMTPCELEGIPLTTSLQRPTKGARPHDTHNPYSTTAIAIISYKIVSQ